MDSNAAEEYLRLPSSYFDMELPKYFNFEPIIEFACERCETLSLGEIKSWKPERQSGLNYILMYNKDGRIGWRPFELINPLIYAFCVKLITQPDNWQIVCERFSEFSKGIVECCSIPVVVEQKQKKKAKKEQILNWWKRVEQRSLELSLEYSHLSHTDVSNCYPSIYSHSIGWAIHGRDFLKKPKNRFDDKLLGVALDVALRGSREGQTNGIPQASLLSHILAELVLGYCDTMISDQLKDEDVKILQYRDDYRIFGQSDTSCAKALKVISECLNEFGMKLGASKTVNATNAIAGAVKQEKLDALEVKIDQTTLQKELLLIHRYTLKRPGSGAIKFLLSEFGKHLSEGIEQNQLALENKTVLVAILMDISAMSPQVFPAAATAVSQILQVLPKNKAALLFGLVLERTKRIPNSGYMEIWLQRIALPNEIEFLSTEQMCHALEPEQPSIWNFSWIEDKGLRARLERYSIIDHLQIEGLEKTIQREEFDAFWHGYK